jgi:hypothetical protein
VLFVDVVSAAGSLVASASLHDGKVLAKESAPIWKEEVIPSMEVLIED